MSSRLTFEGLRRQFGGATLYSLEGERIIARRDNTQVIVSLSDKGKVTAISAWSGRNFSVPSEGTAAATAKIHLGVLALLREARAKTELADRSREKMKIALETCAAALRARGISSIFVKNALVVSDSKVCQIRVGLRSGFLHLSLDMVSSSGEEIADRLAMLR